MADTKIISHTLKMTSARDIPPVDMAVEQLSNVEVSSPSANQVLAYDATDQKFKNKDQVGTANNPSDGFSHVTHTQAEYDALTTKAANTIYFIVEG